MKIAVIMEGLKGTLTLLCAILISSLCFSQSLFNGTYQHFKTPLNDESLTSLNYHLPTSLDSNNEIKTDLNDISLFAVFQSPLKIQKILEARNKNLYLEENKIIGFEEVNIDNGSFPKIITYKESVKYNLSKEKVDLHFLQEDAFYEAIFFPYSVSNFKRKQIETYLGLKYSITLGHDYYSSDGDTIFNLEKNAPFINNIFGIGKDEGSGLDQKQSMGNAGILQISIGDLNLLNKANESEIDNKNFVIISDDGSDLEFESEENSKYQYINKVWKFQTMGETIGKESFQLYLNTEKLGKKLQKDDTYWLVISSNKEIINKDEKNQFIPFKIFDLDNGILRISDLNLDPLNSEFLFTIAKLKELDINYEVYKKSCSENGKLQVNINAPAQINYTYQLIDSEGKFLKKIANNKIEFDDLQEGLYTLTIENANGVIFNESIIISSFTNNRDEKIEISSLSGGRINAYEYISKNITELWWEKDGIYITNQAELFINEEGNYTLFYINNKGCMQYKTFSFNSGNNNYSIDFNQDIPIFLSPNPVKANSDFNIYINFDTAMDMVISIYTFDGQLIDKEELYQKKNGMIQKSLSQTGSYIVIVETPNNIYRQKLLVN